MVGDPARVLRPGDTIGILGGGQLGRMLALAAAPLGLQVHVYAPEPDSPAFAVAARHTVAAYEDASALDAFASAVDAITYEFENIPVETVRDLAARVPVRPGAKALGVAQDRLQEKALARALGAVTAPYAPVLTADDLDRALAAIGVPAILKTARLGYDGKGQAKITATAEAAAGLAAMGGHQAILESFIDFRAEISVIAARGLDGAFAAFDPTENQHRHHILHRSIVPAAVAPATAARAVAITRAIADALDYIGVLGVEFFVAGQGADERLLVNEIAPRVHNSGHWTQDGALTSQFEQHIRAVAGWPLGSPARLGAGTEMINLIGDDADGWAALLTDPRAKLHLYGKHASRPGRKMGHVNRVLDAPCEP